MTTSPWKEEKSYSFFARATQLKCMLAIQKERFDVDVPDGLDDAITWLRAQLDQHWDDQHGYYCTFEPGTPVTPPPAETQRAPYDPTATS